MCSSAFQNVLEHTSLRHNQSVTSEGCTWFLSHRGRFSSRFTLLVVWVELAKSDGTLSDEACVMNEEIKKLSFFDVAYFTQMSFSRSWKNLNPPKILCSSMSSRKGQSRGIEHKQHLTKFRKMFIIFSSKLDSRNVFFTAFAKFSSSEFRKSLNISVYTKLIYFQ